MGGSWSGGEPEVEKTAPLPGVWGSGLGDKVLCSPQVPVSRIPLQSFCRRQKCLFWRLKDQTCTSFDGFPSGQKAVPWDPSAHRNSSCHLCVPSITLKDCPVILSGPRGFSSPFIKPGEQRQLGEGLGTSKHPVTPSVRLRPPRGGLGAVYRWGQITAAQSSFPSPGLGGG